MTDKPDLTRLRALGRKVVVHIGLADELIPPAGAVNWYHRVTERMGGIEQVQTFMRMYTVPGAAHSAQGRPYAAAGKNDAVPIPRLPGNANQTPARDQDQMIDWVEKGVAPGEIVIPSRDGSVSHPICVYPLKTTWNGTGSPKEAAN